jgi:hypothetical protein
MRKASFLILIFNFLLFTFYLKPVLAFQQSSTNYQLEGDFNIFAGSKSSANYSLTDTGGGLGPGISTSTNYGIGAGFQYVLAKSPNIAFSFSPGSISFTSLSTLSVTSGTQTLTVVTNLARGYHVYISQDDKLRDGAKDINPVADGAVTAGHEEYGLSTDKTSQDITYDVDCAETFNGSAITSLNQSVASSAVDVPGGDVTHLCYSASIDNMTPAGNYSQIITFIVVGNF